MSKELNNIDLLDCPFCGEKPIYQARTESLQHPGNFWAEAVMCKPCSIYKSVKAWNTRFNKQESK